MNVTMMNIGYGGTQREIYPKNINQNFGYLGLCDKIIEVGDDHYKVLQMGGNVPFWMTPKELISTNFSYCDEPSKKY